MKILCGNASGEGGDRVRMELRSLALNTSAGEVFLWQREWRGRGNRVKMELRSFALNTTAGEVFSVGRGRRERVQREGGVKLRS